MGQDLVVVFDIESGIWKGEVDPETFQVDEKEERILREMNRIFRAYDSEYLTTKHKKITIPRYVSVGLMPWDTFERGCYQDPELAFLYKMDRHTFCLGEDHIDQFMEFWEDILKWTLENGNVLLLAHNANYDIGGILNACKTDQGNKIIDFTREFIAAHDGSYTAFPDSVHDDKTFDIKIGSKHIRMIDTLNLSPHGCRSLGQFGIRASSMYGKDYHKGDQYDYDFEIRTVDDLFPSPDELAYTDRDLQLCLFAAMLSIYSYRLPLMGRGRHYTASDFPFSATQRDKAVNDGLTIQMRYPDKRRSFWKRQFRLIQKNFQNWCERWGNAPDLHTYELMNKAGTGGIITCNESYVGKPVEDVGSMDLGSSYPAAGGDFLYPRIEIEKGYTGPMDENVFYQYLNAVLYPMAEELRTGKMVLDSMCVNHKWSIGLRVGFVCKVRFHGILYHDFGKDRNGLQYWLPTLPYKDFGERVNREKWKTLRGKVVDNDELEYYSTHIGLLIILAFYDIDRIEFLEGYTYEMRVIQQTIWDRFHAGLIGKQRAKQIRKEWESGKISDEEMIEQTGLLYLKGQDHDTIKKELKAFYDASKVPLNAMYGANYRKLLRDTRVITEEDEYTLGAGEYDPSTAVAYPTGEYIAIYGQLKIAHAMLWAMSKKLPLLYVHTDSLKIQGLTPELVSEYNDLIKEPPTKRNGEPVSFRSYGVGLMDYEGSHDLAVVLGNMRMVCWDKEEGFDITMSGLNESKAFPKEKLKGLDFFGFCSKYLDDGHLYSVDSDTASGKTNTDWSLAGRRIPGIGRSMQSIDDSAFVLNNPASRRQQEIVLMYEILIGEYHDAAWYARRKYVIKNRE